MVPLAFPHQEYPDRGAARGRGAPEPPGQRASTAQAPAVSQASDGWHWPHPQVRVPPASGLEVVMRHYSSQAPAALKAPGGWHWPRVRDPPDTDPEAVTRHYSSQAPAVPQAIGQWRWPRPPAHGRSDAGRQPGRWVLAPPGVASPGILYRGTTMNQARPEHRSRLGRHGSTWHRSAGYPRNPWNRVACCDPSSTLSYAPEFGSQPPTVAVVRETTFVGYYEVTGSPCQCASDRHPSTRTNRRPIIALGTIAGTRVRSCWPHREACVSVSSGQRPPLYQ